MYKLFISHYNSNLQWEPLYVPLLQNLEVLAKIQLQQNL
jgi:hypothetical protein